MRARLLRLLFLLWLSAWFGVFVPWHERGQVTLPGGPASVASSCCPADRDTPSAAAAPPPSCHATTAPAGDAESSQDRAARCAVCHIVATLATPPVFTLGLPTVELLGLIPLPPTDSVAGFEPQAIPLGRGPPRLSA